MRVFTNIVGDDTPDCRVVSGTAQRGGAEQDGSTNDRHSEIYERLDSRDKKANERPCKAGQISGRRGNQADKEVVSTGHTMLKCDSSQYGVHVCIGDFFAILKNQW